MLLFNRNVNKNTAICLNNLIQNHAVKLASTATDTKPSYDDEEEFRVLNLKQTKSKQRARRQIEKKPVPPPRFQKLPTDQDWGTVWTGPRSFHPATVPLPIRQGYVPKGTAPPDKIGNAELMKIPNFLHLTPPVIKKQCEAIKKFCSDWPEGLGDEEIANDFPMEVITSDYCHGLPTIRNPLARIVTVKLKLSNLPLDKHAKDKLLRLVGERYDPETDILTIVTDRCPLRKQNYDYAQYLLTAVFHESWITEPWEATKTEADMEEYIWARNKSKETSEAIINWKTEDSNLKSAPQEYAEGVEILINEGENEVNLQKYKNEVLKLFDLQSETNT